MQARLSNDSTEPKAQQVPHDDWSRTLPITVQLGHLSTESKLSGMSAALKLISFTAGSS
jgi:hypothetical protein